MPGINYTLGMNPSGFNAGVSGALGKLADLGKKAAMITSTAGLAAGAGIGALIAKSIGKAAEMEDLEAGFAPLLGGFDAARQRMEELAKFAAATPFELPQIAQASMQLETITKGALSTGAALTMVGDVAAGPFKGDFLAASEAIGELYDALHNGGDIGDVVSRLQQLGAISGDAKRAMLALHAETGNGAQAWKIATGELAKFDGMMAVKAGTWNGKMSTLTDAVSALMAKFGKPIMDSLKPYLDGLIVKVESLTDFGVRMGEKIGKSLELAFAAFQSGNAFAAVGAMLKLGFLDAVNALAKNLRAAVAASLEAFKISGVLLAIDATFTSITFRMSAALRGAMGDFMEGLGRHGIAKDMRDQAALEQTASGDAMSIARQALDSFDIKTTYLAFTEKFKEQLNSLPDLIDTSDTKKAYEDSMKEINKMAADLAAQREKLLQEMDQKMKNRPQAGAAGGTAATDPAGKAAQVAASARPSVDRLAQIGGYVGGAARGIARGAAEKTASYMEKAVVKLASIDRRIAQTQPAGVFL